MMRVHRLGRYLLSLLLVATVAAPAMADAAKLRIGYQKGGTLIILKAHGTVEKRLALQGVAVEWVEFAPVRCCSRRWAPAASISE
jgi:sulfonate transport system substrate-binding protein